MQYPFTYTYTHTNRIYMGFFIKHKLFFPFPHNFHNIPIHAHTRCISMIVFHTKSTSDQTTYKYIHVRLKCFKT